MMEWSFTPTTFPANTTPVRPTLTSRTLGNISKGPCEVGASLSMENILYVNLLVAILICCVVGNSFVIVAGFMSQRLKDHVTTCFIISLACSDLLSALIGVPFRIAGKLYGDQFCYHTSVCYVYIISDAIGNMASIFNLLLLAVDRFVAIRMPYRYIDHFTKRRCKQMVLAVWMFSFLWAFIGIFRWKGGNGSTIFSIDVENVCFNDNHLYYATSFVMYLAVFAVITCTYCSILNIALGQIKSIKKTERATSRLISTMSRESETDKLKKHKWKTMHRELKATKAIAIVYLAFVACWMPSAIINIIILFDHTYFYPMQIRNKKLFLFIYYFCVQLLPVFNTMINPIIYSFSNHHFRFAFKRLAAKLIGKELVDRKFRSQKRKRKKSAAKKLIDSEKKHMTAL